MVRPRVGPARLLAMGSAADESSIEPSDSATTRHAAKVPVRRWNPWNAVIAVVLTTGVFALERLLGVNPWDALVDAALVLAVATGGVPEVREITMSDSDRLAFRLAAAVRARHRFDSDLSYDPERCGCESCLRGEAIMAQLNQPATHQATERLVAQAREDGDHRTVTLEPA